MFQRKVYTLKHIPLTALELNSSCKPNSTQKACFVLIPNLFLLFIMLTYLAVPQQISKTHFIHYTENLLNCSSVLPTQQIKVFHIFQKKFTKPLLIIVLLKVKTCIFYCKEKLFCFVNKSGCAGLFVVPEEATQVSKWTWSFSYTRSCDEVILNSFLPPTLYFPDPLYMEFLLVHVGNCIYQTTNNVSIVFFKATFMTEASNVTNLLSSCFILHMIHSEVKSPSCQWIKS